MATDGVLSYVIFTYLCGGLNWLSYNYASIGFSVTQDFFANHELSLTPDVNDIACTCSVWSNVIYQVGNSGMCEINIKCIMLCTGSMHSE